MQQLSTFSRSSEFHRCRVMHSPTSRANSVLTYGAIVLFVAAVISHITSYGVKKHPALDSKDINLNLVYLAPMPRRGFMPPGDEAQFDFELHADFRSLWNWNTKMLFVYITAEYISEANVFNQVVVWDDRVRSREEALLNLNEKMTEYGLNDKGNFLRGVTANFTLNVCEMPITGLLLWSSPISFSVPLPKDYTKRRQSY